MKVIYESKLSYSVNFVSMVNTSIILFVTRVYNPKPIFNSVIE